MNVSTVYGFAFLCVPKTGSTSIKKAILEHSTISYGWKHSLKHMSARTFHSHIMPFHKSLFPDVNLEVSCVMRDPVHWAYSWYRFRKRPELRNGNTQKKAMYTGGVSFEKFVDELTDTRSKTKFASIGDQSKYLLMDNGKLGVDRVFKFEAGFEVIDDYFRGKIGQKISIQKLNASESPSSELSNELRERLKEYFSKDQALYDGLD